MQENAYNIHRYAAIEIVQSGSSTIGLANELIEFTESDWRSNRAIIKRKRSKAKKWIVQSKGVKLIFFVAEN